ncbi:protein kinase, ATP binding site-containing protein [Tanacetum coccineum]
MRDMTACLNDLSYILPNNEQNELTQGDIDETSNEPTQAIRNEFEELYASANEERYPGCDYVIYFKVKGKLTYSIFNEMLEFFQNVFPTAKGYKLPPSYYAIKKIFKTIKLGYESIHACVNDCLLFRGDANKDMHLCLVCNTSSWKDSNTQGKKVPKKVLCYFLIISRLQRLYKSSHTAKAMTWHSTEKYTEPVLKHVASDTDNIQSASVVMYEREFFHADVTIDDFLARSSLSGWSGQGYKACPTCNEDTPSTRVLGKTAYVGHKRFLKKPHIWRRSHDFNGEIEDGDVVSCFLVF